MCLCTINGLNVSNLFRRVLCLTRKIEKGSGQVAVAVGILIQIVLMVFFCRIEIPKWQFLDSDRLWIKGLLLSKHLIDNRELIVADIIDTCAIASAFVVSLTVEAHGIDGLEEHIQQEFKTDYLFIVFDVHRFSIACLVGIDFLIGGIVSISVGKAYFLK